MMDRIWCKVTGSGFHGMLVGTLAMTHRGLMKFMAISMGKREER